MNQRPPDPWKCARCTAMSAADPCPICKTAKPKRASVTLIPCMTAAQAHQVSQRLGARLVLDEQFNFRLRPDPLEAA